MKYFGKGLSELHKKLATVIRKKEELDTAKQLFLSLHSKLHRAEISEGSVNEVDRLLKDLTGSEYRVMPTIKDETIAWAIWHIARIEDLTMNILVAGTDQVFSEGWKKQMGAPIEDTGNTLTDDEIMELSFALDIPALKAYRNAVGLRTRQIVSALSAGDLRRRVSPPDLQKIRDTGGVTEHADSIWLLDFWGKKDVAGLLLMPPTRHVMLHLNDCCKWKEHIRNGKKCFRSASPD